MSGTVWDNFSSLLGHQIYQLVDQEGGREGCHTSDWYSDQLPTYWTPEPKVSGISGNDPLETGDTDSVGTWQQLGTVVIPIIST